MARFTAYARLPAALLALLLLGCASKAPRQAPPAVPVRDHAGGGLGDIAARVAVALPDQTVRILDGAVRALVPAGRVFDPDAASLRASGAVDLAPLARLIAGCHGCTAQIVVHTDALGAAADNLRFSAARAAALVARFEEAGVPAARLGGRGAGEAEPVATQDTPADREANRRIEIIIRP